MARVLTVRPFVIGSLYLLFALPGGGALRGVVAAGLLGVCYPYLFWVYTLPVAVAHLWRGDRRFGAGTLAAHGRRRRRAAAGILGAPRAAWRVRRRSGRRSRIKITEFRPVTAEPLLGGALLLALVCILPFLPAGVPQGRGPPPADGLLRPGCREVRPLPDRRGDGAALRRSAAPGWSTRSPRGWSGSARSGWSGCARSWRRLRPRAARRPGARRGRREPAPGDRRDPARPRRGARRASRRQRHRDDAALAQALDAVPKGSLVLTDFNLQYRAPLRAPGSAAGALLRTRFPRRRRSSRPTGASSTRATPAGWPGRSARRGLSGRS